MNRLMRIRTLSPCF